jgi:putative hydrolase of the HAD superfamily
MLNLFQHLIEEREDDVSRVSMNQSRIEVILYDLGNVILPFNHYQIAEKLARFSQGEESTGPEAIFSFLFAREKGAINQYETGKVSTSEFFLDLKRSFRLSLTFEAFVPIWNDIFVENPEVSETILSQKGRWKLGLLSNTNSLHFGYALSKFPIVRVFDRWILSHEVGFKKPDVEIFKKAMEWASVEPGKILFIDDLKKNVETAVSLGMQGIHFTSAQQLKEELSRRLT